MDINIFFISLEHLVVIFFCVKLCINYYCNWMIKDSKKYNEYKIFFYKPIMN